MALRPMGVYLLTSTALYSQTRTTYHLTNMSKLAAESASLALLADAELESSFELQSKSAIESEEGLALQTESVEMELDAEREFVKAATETAMGNEYQDQAEVLREKSAQDVFEGDASLTHAEEMQLQSAELHVQAEKDRTAAALNEEKSLSFFEESTTAGEIAAGAEEKAAEYEAIAIRREGQSLKDGEALLKTETGAMEDAEAMAACTPIPVLNLICDAVGAVIEAGYQGIAAFEGAKAAVETISAVTAQRKEQAELVMAVENQEEAARLAVESEQFQVKADEESGKAAFEESDSEATKVDAGEAQLLGDEKIEQSEEEEALAAFDVERASEQYAKAARDESIALEEESSAVASQIESEELLTESTSEEFVALAERFDGESKEMKVENMMNKSVGHGINALGLALHAIITAGLVVYVVVMRGLAKTVMPGVARVWSGESPISAAYVAERMCGFAMHVGVVIGTIASMPNLLSNFEDIPAILRIRSLLYLVAAAGAIESIGIHTTHAVCCCYIKGIDMIPTLATAILTFFSNVVHLVPVVLMEILIFLTVLGPGIFKKISLNPAWIWGTLLLCIFIRVMKLRKLEAKPVPNKLPIDEECEFLFASDGQRSIHVDVNKEYGSLEDVSILTDENGDGSWGVKSSSSTTNDDASAPTKCLEKCSNWFCSYFEGLRLSSDLLLLTLMAVLLYHCWPLLRVLLPLAKTSMGMIATWVSLPVLIVVGLVLGVIVHFLFVH